MVILTTYTSPPKIISSSNSTRIPVAKNLPIRISPPSNFARDPTNGAEFAERPRSADHPHAASFEAAREIPRHLLPRETPLERPTIQNLESEYTAMVDRRVARYRGIVAPPPDQQHPENNSSSWSVRDAEYDIATEQHAYSVPTISSILKKRERSVDRVPDKQELLDVHPSKRELHPIGSTPWYRSSPAGAKAYERLGRSGISDASRVARCSPGTLSRDFSDLVPPVASMTFPLAQTATAQKAGSYLLIDGLQVRRAGDGAADTSSVPMAGSTSVFGTRKRLYAAAGGGSPLRSPSNGGRGGEDFERTLEVVGVSLTTCMKIVVL